MGGGEHDVTTNSLLRLPIQSSESTRTFLAILACRKLSLWNEKAVADIPAGDPFPADDKCYNLYIHSEARSSKAAFYNPSAKSTLSLLRSSKFHYPVFLLRYAVYF